MIKNIFFIFVCFPIFLVKGQNSLDSVAYIHKSYTFRPKQLITPLTLTAAGVIGICDFSSNSLNNKVKKGMYDLRGNQRISGDDYIQYLPVASHLGLFLMGAKSEYSFIDRIIVTSTSYLTMGILVNSIKLTVNQSRPDSSAKNSFPSGHTATAFMGAELVRLAYKDDSLWYGFGAYMVAGSVGFFRLYNERHWVSDVLAGAGIGILSARIGYWLLPSGQKLLKLNSNNEVTIIPFYDREKNTWGSSIAILF